MPLANGSAPVDEVRPVGLLQNTENGWSSRARNGSDLFVPQLPLLDQLEVEASTEGNRRNRDAGQVIGGNFLPWSGPFALPGAAGAGAAATVMSPARWGDVSEGFSSCKTWL
ncbi:MAG: hypothetical protein U1F83_01540 [Verrucomicrobiota bacterium]